MAETSDVISDLKMLTASRGKGWWKAVPSSAGRVAAAFSGWRDLRRERGDAQPHEGCVSVAVQRIFWKEVALRGGRHQSERWRRALRQRNQPEHRWPGREPAGNTSGATCVQKEASGPWQGGGQDEGRQGRSESGLQWRRGWSRQDLWEGRDRRAVFRPCAHPGWGWGSCPGCSHRAPWGGAAEGGHELSFRTNTR